MQALQDLVLIGSNFIWNVFFFQITIGAVGANSLIGVAATGQEMSTSHRFHSTVSKRKMHVKEELRLISIMT